MSQVYASIPRRLMAFGADYVLIALYLMLLTIFFTYLMPPKVAQSLFADPLVGQVSVFLILTLPVILYYALMESSSWCGTLGKRFLGIAVQSSGHTQPTISKTLCRALIKFLPWELSHTCLWRVPGWPRTPQEPPWLVYVGFALVWLLVAVYIVGALRNPRRQTLYDLLSGCVVVRVRKDGQTE